VLVIAPAPENVADFARIAAEHSTSAHLSSAGRTAAITAAERREAVGAASFRIVPRLQKPAFGVGAHSRLVRTSSVVERRRRGCSPRRSGSRRAPAARPAVDCWIAHQKRPRRDPARRGSLHAFAQGSRAIRAGQKRQRRSRQHGDAVGAELVAAFRREEPPGAGGRDVCLSGIAAVSAAESRWPLSTFCLPPEWTLLALRLALLFAMNGSVL
jgi:hypothetical protein